MPMLSTKPSTAAATLGLLACVAATWARAEAPSGLSAVNHIVVIYQENHSFDNLFGGWEGVEGIAQADPEHTQQVAQDGTAYDCLLQNDPGLTSPKPLEATCKDRAHRIESAFRNAPFHIDTFVPPVAPTCPGGKPGGAPGGCTRDLVHRFYQEQYQLNGGHMNRYVTGSDAVGLAMGVYDTRRLPIYTYLHAQGHPHYVIADRFFQAAFGGSLLNHHWLVAAATPVFKHAVADGSADDLHAVLDANGMPAVYPLYKPEGEAKAKDSAPLTAPCTEKVKSLGLACGSYAVNTIQPAFQPYAPGAPEAKRLRPQVNPTIGDALRTAGVDWAWYSGGWSNANGDVGAPGWTNEDGKRCSDPATQQGAVAPHCPNRLFQFHHQPFNYYAAFDPGTAAGRANRKAHLKDEAGLMQLVGASGDACRLKPVSFVKPIGADNEHPGYASESVGAQHALDLIRAIEESACAPDTLIILTYDEFGGQWDHVPPPGQGGAPGPHDIWGPGTRVPALLLSPLLPAPAAVDHTLYDTTSILATIERRFGLEPLSSRDASVKDLSEAWSSARPLGTSKGS